MPATSFFADGRDVNLLIDRLNSDPEIAFLVPDGPLDPEAALANRLRASLGDSSEAAFYGPLGVERAGRRRRVAGRRGRGVVEGGPPRVQPRGVLGQLHSFHGI
jgi:hypothetical protein